MMIPIDFYCDYLLPPDHWPVDSIDGGYVTLRHHWPFIPRIGEEIMLEISEDDEMVTGRVTDVCYCQCLPDLTDGGPSFEVSVHISKAR